MIAMWCYSFTVTVIDRSRDKVGISIKVSNEDAEIRKIIEGESDARFKLENVCWWFVIQGRSIPRSAEPFRRQHR